MKTAQIVTSKGALTLELYDTETKPLVDFYRERSVLVAVNGLGTEDDVQAELLRAVATRFAS